MYAWYASIHGLKVMEEEAVGFFRRQLSTPMLDTNIDTADSRSLFAVGEC